MPSSGPIEFETPALSLHEAGRRLSARVLSGNGFLDRIITHVAITDLMSRVLAHTRPGTLLLTGLDNIQVINTAEVAGLAGVVFLNSDPGPVVVAKAAALGIPIFFARCSRENALSLLRAREEGGEP